MNDRRVYRMTEIGEIPDDWKVRPIGEICHKPQYGYTASATEKAVGAKFLRITDIKDGRVNWDEVPYCDCPDEVIDNYILRPGDILFARTGSTGKSFLISSCPRAVFGSYLIRLRAKSDVDVQYLSYFLDSSCYWRQVSQKSGGSIQSGINASLLSSIQVPIASLGEQRKIASVLCTVDGAIQKTDEIIAKTQQLKKGLMQQLLTRGIGHAKFKQTEIGEIPEEWESGKVGEVCEVIMGQSPPGNSYNNRGVGLPLLNGPTEFGETTPIPLQWTGQPTKTCSSNDVLLCVRGNTTGRINTADREYCVGRGVAAIRAKSGKTDSHFIKYVFQRLEPRILQVASGAGSTFPNINRDEISSLPIPVPPLAEQLKISEILLGADEKTARERTRRQHLSRLKNGLMQVLLTGKVRVKVD